MRDKISCDFVNSGPNYGQKGVFESESLNDEKEKLQILLLGSRSLNIVQMHFIFGIIDVTIDTEQLAKKFLNFVHFCPNNREKGITVDFLSYKKC